MSGIKPPSKIPSLAAGRELSELSTSQSNVRATSNACAAPAQVIGLKHKTSHGQSMHGRHLLSSAHTSCSARAGAQAQDTARPSCRTIPGKVCRTVERSWLRRRNPSRSGGRRPANLSLLDSDVESHVRVVANNLGDILRRERWLDRAPTFAVRPVEAEHGHGTQPHELIPRRDVSETVQFDGSVPACAESSARG